MSAAEGERLKYLFKAVLGVDVDAIVSQVVATVAVERAEQVRRNSEDWRKYMQAEGSVVFLPRRVMEIGRSGGRP